MLRPKPAMRYLIFSRRSNFQSKYILKSSVNKPIEKHHILLYHYHSPLLQYFPKVSQQKKYRLYIFFFFFLHALKFYNTKINVHHRKLFECEKKCHYFYSINTILTISMFTILVFLWHFSKRYKLYKRKCLHQPTCVCVCVTNNMLTFLWL